MEGKEARATMTALIVEDTTQAPSRMRGVRIDLEHLVSSPNCDLIYPAWAIMCRRAHAAVYIEDGRLEEVSTWILRGAAQLRPREYISEYHRGDAETGLIICGYTLSNHQPVELADLIDTAIDKLRSAPR